MPPQRLVLAQQAVADANGNGQFTFPTPPTNLVWQGTMTCATAPGTGIFVAFVGGSQWCSWAGSSIGGPVQAMPGEQVVVTVTGLTAGTTYVLQWIGRSDSLSDTSPSYPDTNSSPGGVVSQSPGSTFAGFTIGGALLVSQTQAGAGTVSLLAAPAAKAQYYLHNVTFTLGSGATSAQLVGHTTGFVYCQADNSAELFSALQGQIVTEQLDFTMVGGGGSVWLSYDKAVPTSGGGVNGLTSWGQALTATFFGSGSPVGTVTPGHIGDLYVDDSTPALWQATGVTNTSWDQIGPPVTIVTTVFTANAYTLAISDAFTSQQASNGAAGTITVPANATVAFPVGTVITFTQTGAGKVSLAAAGGVTLNSPGALLGCRAQYSTIALQKTATNTWTVTGDLG